MMIRRSLVFILPLLLFASCSKRSTIVVGAKAFTEGYILGHMATYVLEDAGLDVEEQFGLATAAMRSALENGQVDLYYEYTGTAYTVYFKGADPNVMSDSAKVLEQVRTLDEKNHALRWLRPLPFNDTYALLMRRDDSRRRGIVSLGDLAKALDRGEKLRIAVDAEFYERPDGLKALLAAYGMPERDVVKLDPGLTYKALASGEVDVAMGYSTDGRIPALDLIVLADNRSFFPAYNPAPVIRSATLRTNPAIEQALEKLMAIDTETMQQLNAEVDVHHRDPRKVALRWLVERGILQKGSRVKGNG